MAIKKKKKVAKKAKRSFAASGAGSTQVSSLRPKYTKKIPPCNVACPSSETIRSYLTTVAQKDEYGLTLDQATKDAWHILTAKNPFPSVCGRVCPHPCETGCNRAQFDTPVAINNVERYIGDFGIKNNLEYTKPNEKYSEKVAVIGSGPGGMSCAYQLAKMGYSVTVFEQFAESGGMLRYGIPSYRLPRDVLDAEVQKIVDLGVEMRYNTKIGKDISIDELKKEYKAFFLGIGAHVGYELGVEGEDAPNVYSGADFLNRFNAGETIEVGDKVLIVGGGDSAIDCARTCRRLGADVSIVYRRGKAEMPAIAHEIDEAEKEGVKLELLTAPISFVKEGDKATGMNCLRMELGEPDSSGRRRPVPIKGSEFVIEASTVIAAISQEPDFTGFEQFKHGKDWVRVNDQRMTNVDSVFAGGDVIELMLVTTAIGHGRMAAENIHHYIRGTKPSDDNKMEVVSYDKLNTRYYSEKPRHEYNSISLEDRLGTFNEVNFTLSPDEFLEETKRCFSCGMCFDCDNCWSYCQDGVIEKLPKGQHYDFYKMEQCIGCKKCAEECPCGYIDMI